jgi:NADH-quinone oxidoreductase subunit I
LPLSVTVERVFSFLALQFPLAFMAVIQVQRKPLSFAERTYLPQVFGGLMITLRHFFGRRVTLEYPEQRPEISPGYRGVPTLVKDPNGREKCVSCQLCEFVCPPKAIRITPGEISDNASDAHVEKAPREFEINMLRCIYCGLCQEVCPEEAIFLQNVYSLSGYSRDELVNNKEKLYELGGTLPDRHSKWDKKKAAADAAAP